MSGIPGKSPTALQVLLEHDLASFGNHAALTKPHPWMSVGTYAASYLREEVFRKYEPSRSMQQKNAAVSKFLQINETCRRFKLEVQSSLDELLIGNLREVLYHFFYEDGQRTIFDVPLSTLQVDFGPGASKGSVGCDVVSKLAGPIGASSRRLVTYYDRLLVKGSELWLANEITRMAVHGNPKVVEGSNLRTVPKNDLTDRVIMVEPAINMLFQMGLGRLIEDRLRVIFGISFDQQQEINRGLARESSVTDELCTLDLSSASDSLSIRMLKEVMPFQALLPMLYVRSPRTFDGKRKITLAMIGTMGNAFTFPLQTALFASVVWASYKTLDEKRRRTTPDGKVQTYTFCPKGGKEWSVFGDDIIVPRRIVSLVMRLLKLLGFTINPDKTFTEGPFRESCGVDSYRGVDVRPVYIRRLFSVQDRLSALNRLAAWSARHDVPIPSVLGALRDSVPWYPVPPWSSDHEGVKVPLHCVTRVKRSSSLHGSYVYMAYDTKQRQRGFKIHDVLTLNYHKVVERGVGPVSCQTALELAFLKGALESQGGSKQRGWRYVISLRSEDHGDVRYVLRERVAPSWDVFPWGLSDPLDPSARRRWNAIATFVLAR